MMDEIINVIANVGFPIACVLLMFKMFREEQKNHIEESNNFSTAINDLKLSFTEALNEVRMELIQAVNNNTQVMQKLVDKMECSK